MRYTKITALIALTAATAFWLILGFSRTAGSEAHRVSAGIPDSSNNNLGSVANGFSPTGSYQDLMALQEARAALRNAVESGNFELMSSAKQMALQLLAQMRYEGGVLKESPAAPATSIAATLKELLPPLFETPDVLANPPVNDPTLDTTAQKTQSETTVLLTGGNGIVSSYNDSGSFVSGNKFTGYSTSTDSGSSWTDRGTIPEATVGNFGDPVLARNNATGKVFLATLAANTNGLNIYSSTDNGLTWNGPVNGAPGTLASDGDKEWIAVDNFVGSGNGNVYHAYRDFGSSHPGVLFTRSTDAGVTFSPNPGLTIASGAAGNVQGAFVFVGSDHAVYVGFYDSTTTPDSIRVRKSTDQGLTFAATVTISNLTTTGTNGSLNVPAGYRSSAFPQFVASPTNANLLFSIHPDITTSGGTDSNIYFNKSTDGGATWSANQQLNTDATTRAQTQPALSIMPDGTALCVTWQDSRADAANTKVQRYGVIGTISGTTVTFGPNFIVSQPNWTPVYGQDPVVNSVYMGDYDTMDADNNFFYTTFVDCRLGNQDVRFAKIPKAGPPPAAVLNVTSFTPTSLTPSTNSCNDLFVTLTNDGDLTATSVSLTLTTSTSGVTILASPQSYGNIAPGASVANATPFKLSVSNTFVCGTSIVINWSVSTGETGSFTITTQGTGYNFTTMTGQTIVPGTTDVGNHTDDLATAITLPFSFTFYGNAFTTANVSSNGNLQFSSSSSEYSNACPLPFSLFTNAVMPFWDDQCTGPCSGVTGTTYGIFTSTSGSAPNRIFNIEWRTAYYNSGGTGIPLGYEIRLYETTGQIDFVYGTLNGTGTSATVGLQKGTGSGPNDVASFSCNTGSLSDGLKISWFPTASCPQGSGSCPTGPTPTATATSTGTPSPTPTATSTSTATATIPPSPTPTATATSTATATVPPTPTPTLTPSPTPTPTPCVNYAYTVSTGTIVPGTTDTGNHTDDNSTVISLPFSYQLFDTSFTSVAVGSNGHLTFGVVNNAFNPGCIPIASATYAIFPYETDLCTGACTGDTGTNLGIFTSISGTAPNRIFNIEWRAAYFNSGQTTNIPLNFEVRLFEGQTAFDVIYGTVPPTFTPPSARILTVGIQKTTTQFTMEGCDATGGGSPPVSSGQLYHYVLGTGCPSATPSPTGTATSTATATLTATATATATASPAATPTPSPTPPVCLTFSNPTAISLPDVTPASPYPSNITVSGFGGALITNISVRLKNITHTFPGDLDMLLVGPGGQTAIIMSDVGGGGDVAGLTLTLDDFAAASMTTNALPASGSATFKPTNLETTGDSWPSPAPTPTPANSSALSVFNGTSPNGVWSLYITDDAGQDTGTIAGGWDLVIATNVCSNTPTPTPTLSPTPTATATGAASPTATATTTGTPNPTPTPCNQTVVSYTGPAVAVPDSDTTGVNMTVVVSGLSTITDLNFRFDGTASSSDFNSTTVGVNHSWIGDLAFKLTSPLGTTVTFYDRPGVPTSTFGCSSNNLYQLTLDDAAGASIETDCPGGGGDNGPQTGIFIPNNPLSAFNGQDPNGTWTLNAVDGAGGDTGSVRAWSLLISGPCSSPTPTPTPITPTPTPTPPVSISGTVTYCPNPSLPPISGVTMTLTGTTAGSTNTDGSGNYSFTALPYGGNYTVTPSKVGISPGGPGSSSISTVDVIAIQKHFLVLGTPLSGCRLLAADVASPSGVNTIDVLATQKFFLQLAGFANVGKYQFNPTSTSYSPLTGDVTSQNYDAIVFGDVISGFVHRPGSGDVSPVSER